MCSVFFFQAEDGIRDLVRSRGLGDVYKRQAERHLFWLVPVLDDFASVRRGRVVTADDFRQGRLLSLIHI